MLRRNKVSATQILQNAHKDNKKENYGMHALFLCVCVCNKCLVYICFTDLRISKVSSKFGSVEVL